MLVKFFKTQNGGSIAGIDYLLNHRAKEGTAKVFKGNKTLTKAIIKNIAKKTKALHGLLKFCIY